MEMNDRNLKVAAGVAAAIGAVSLLRSDTFSRTARKWWGAADTPSTGGCCSGSDSKKPASCCSSDDKQATASKSSCCSSTPANASSCCTPDSKAAGSTDEADDVRQMVRSKYSAVATGDSARCCGGAQVLNKPAAAEQLGYDPKEIEDVDGDMGLGCGNPVAVASLKPGNVVLDLGSGGGFDTFLAARRVGDSGLSIGVDMTPAMISKARKSAQKGGYKNVSFRLGEIEHLPVANDSVDVIISNCVINLSCEKLQVFKEAHRVLKKGGRLCISDVVALKDKFNLPVSDSKDEEQAYCACVTGAVPVTTLEELLNQAGFQQISIKISKKSAEFIKDWYPGAEKEVASATIEATK